MQLPAELQEFLLQRTHFHPQLARHLKQSEVIGSLRQLQQLAATRAEVRAERALVAVPADQRRLCRGGNRAHGFFRNSSAGTKKVAGASGCQPLVPISPRNSLRPNCRKAKSTGQSACATLRRKRAAAAATPRRVGILENKSLAHERLFVLQRRAIQVQKTFRVHKNTCAELLDNLVAVARLRIQA